MHDRRRPHNPAINITTIGVFAVPELHRYSELSIDEAFELCRSKAARLHSDLSINAFKTNDQHVAWVRSLCDEIQKLADVCEQCAQADKQQVSRRR